MGCITDSTNYKSTASGAHKPYKDGGSIVVLLSGWMGWDLWSPALKCFPGRGGFICSMMLSFVIAFRKNLESKVDECEVSPNSSISTPSLAVVLKII